MATTAFQASAFQNNAFQIAAVVVVQDVQHETILQRHKADPPQWRRDVAISRERYREYKVQWAREALQAQRWRAKRKREADAEVGYEKIDDSNAQIRIGNRNRVYEEFLQSLAAQQAQHAALQAQTFTQDMLGRLSTVHALHAAAAHAARIAHMHQTARDDAEEEEALQLLMMDD